jgi:hypothetical protein
MTSLLHGPIAVEYGLLATTIRAKKTDKNTTGETCGSDCTNPDCEEGGHSCPAPVKKEPEQPYKKKAFTPVVAGWSEPPATGR